jgi:hypothetical protein
VTVCDVVVGPAGAEFAGPLALVLGGGLALEELGVGGAGDAVVPDSGVPLRGAGDPGGDVARGGGQIGSKYSASSCRSCDSAWSRLPPGSPVCTCTCPGRRRSCSVISWQLEWPDWP